MKNLEVYRITYAYEEETLYTTTVVATSTYNALTKFREYIKKEDNKNLDDLLAISIINETKRKEVE